MNISDLELKRLSLIADNLKKENSSCRVFVVSKFHDYKNILSVTFNERSGNTTCYEA